jgi:hypothetical protein
MFALPALALLLAACGGDDDTPFNPQGTSDDMAAVSAAFDAPAVQSFNALGDDMDNAFAAPVLGSSARIVQGAIQGPRLRTAGESVARSVRALAGPRGGVALAVIPAEYLGDTYEYDTGSSSYVLGERTGAPANGVRFIVYAVNAITGVPVTPLQEVGYADVLDESTATSDALRVMLVSDGTTYLNYGVTASVGETEIRATIDGFVTDGTTQVDFDLDNVVSDALGGSITLDYELDVPSRDVSLDYLIAMTGSGDNANVDLSLQGPNGSVGIVGALTAGDGVLTARANGGDFAVMDFVDEEVEEITKPDGSALTTQEYGALFAIWTLVMKGFDIFEDLADPVDNLF